MITPIEDARRARDEQTPRQAMWQALWDRLLRDHHANDPTTGAHALLCVEEDDRDPEEARDT